MFRIPLQDFVTESDAVATFSVWLRVINQNPTTQDACKMQLQTYLIRICADIFYLESNGQKSFWIWVALSHWDYLTYGLRVPSPDYWNLGDVLDVTTYRYNDPSCTNIIEMLQSDLEQEQLQYLKMTAAIIQNRL
jgi:hypothetical protein